MKRYVFICMGLIVSHFLGGMSIVAGDLVTFRLVEASNEGEGITPGLNDVESILISQLPFKRYGLIDRAECKLPANQVIKMSRGYTINCNGKQENFTVKVNQGKAEILQTTVALKDGKPLMLGGFPSGKGKLLLILLVK